MTYKQIYDIVRKQVQQNAILRVDDNAFIPFDPANTDYANFKAQINADEAQLEDADGDVMSADAAKTYVATLP
jgi:hypothetical protein